MILNKNLNFIILINYIKNKCNKTLQLLHVVAHTNWGADKEILMKLYKTLIKSKIEYGCVTYSYACRNIVNTIMTNETQFLRKIYLSHFIQNGMKGLCVRGELETEQNCNILTPSSSGYSSTSFSFSWAAQPGTLRVASPQSGAGSHTDISSPKPWLPLTELPVTLGYIIVWHPPASCGHHICTQLNLSTVKVIPWYLRPDALVIYTGAFLIWQLGRVGGQYVTDVSYTNQK